MNNWLQSQLDRALVGKCGLREYVKLAFHQVEPGTNYVHGGHIDAICEHLEAVTKGQITRLIICQPPGTMKSLLTSVMWPTWEWIKHPHIRWIYASNDYKVSMRDNLKSRQLIESPWYQERFGQCFQVNKAQWQTVKYSNQQGGFRTAISVGSNVVGQHADRQVGDDLIRPQDAHPDIIDIPALEKVIAWWNGTMSSRLVPSIKSSRVIVMQRLHESDPVGYLLKSNHGYECLTLPMEYESNRSFVTVLGFKDWRTQEGELLWPELHTAEIVAEKKRELGERLYATQYQQRPAPPGGSLFKRDWMRQYWKELPRQMHVIQSWDTAFKGDTDSDYVVGQVWGYAKGAYYLVDQIRAKLDVPAQLAAIISFSAKHKNAHTKLIEEAASGAGLVAMLKEKGLSGVVAEPTNNKSKVSRAISVLPLFEAGNVWLPHPDKAPWVHDFIEELLVVPNGRHDDQCDAMTQALSRLRQSKSQTYIKALQQMK